MIADHEAISIMTSMSGLKGCCRNNVISISKIVLERDQPLVCLWEKTAGASSILLLYYLYTRCAGSPGLHAYSCAVRTCTVYHIKKLGQGQQAMRMRLPLQNRLE